MKVKKEHQGPTEEKKKETNPVQNLFENVKIKLPF
jgi:hypothetical protein